MGDALPGRLRANCPLAFRAGAPRSRLDLFHPFANLCHASILTARDLALFYQAQYCPRRSIARAVSAQFSPPAAPVCHSCKSPQAWNPSPTFLPAPALAAPDSIARQPMPRWPQYWPQRLPTSISSGAFAARLKNSSITAASRTPSGPCRWLRAWWSEPSGFSIAGAVRARFAVRTRQPRLVTSRKNQKRLRRFTGAGSMQQRSSPRYLNCCTGFAQGC